MRNFGQKMTTSDLSHCNSHVLWRHEFLLMSWAKLFFADPQHSIPTCYWKDGFFFRSRLEADDDGAGHVLRRLLQWRISCDVRGTGYQGPVSRISRGQTGDNLSRRRAAGVPRAGALRAQRELLEAQNFHVVRAEVLAGHRWLLHSPASPQIPSGVS